jgi:hypothetical protein
MLLAPYHYDKEENTYYCRHINDKNLELYDILIDYDKYVKLLHETTSYKCTMCVYCVSTIPTDIDGIILKKKNSTSYNVTCSTTYICRISGQGCITSDARYLLLGKYFNVTVSIVCILNRWKTKTCKDCGEKNPNDIFKTICDSCILMKSNELHYCASHLDYNTDVTNIIIDQLQEIKNYFIGLKN